MWLHHFDPSQVSCRRCEPRIESQKWRAQAFRERNIHGVVGGKIRPQRPGAGQEGPVIVQVESEACQIPQRLTPAKVGQLL